MNSAEVEVELISATLFDSAFIGEVAPLTRGKITKPYRAPRMEPALIKGRDECILV
jgi:hypothetical protein